MPKFNVFTLFNLNHPLLNYVTEERVT